MNTAQDNYALITGASSGIGWEYAKQLTLEHGYNLIVVARRDDRLNALKEELLRVLVSKRQ